MKLRRREYLGALGAAGLGGVAGCLGSDTCHDDTFIVGRGPGFGKYPNSYQFQFDDGAVEIEVDSVTPSGDSGVLALEYGDDRRMLRVDDGETYDLGDAVDGALSHVPEMTVGPMSYDEGSGIEANTHRIQFSFDEDVPYEC